MRSFAFYILKIYVDSHLDYDEWTLLIYSRCSQEILTSAINTDVLLEDNATLTYLERKHIMYKM